jgi:retron-type reverse transcriptase
VIVERFEGAPQGGPLSPLLANVLLDEVDRELARRGHRFVPQLPNEADDCNVYVRSRWAGERVLAGLKKLYGRLHLKVSEAKTAVAPATGRKFLGFELWRSAGDRIQCAVARKALETVKQRIGEITRRT